LARRHGISRDEILETGVDPFVGRRLRVRDVAGYVLHREGLRLQTTHCSRKSVEQTHDIISANEYAPPERGSQNEILGESIAIGVPEVLLSNIRYLGIWSAAPQRVVSSAHGSFCRLKFLKGER
jgi:hypothetical protein